MSESFDAWYTSHRIQVLRCAVGIALLFVIGLLIAIIHSAVVQW